MNLLYMLSILRNRWRPFLSTRRGKAEMTSECIWRGKHPLLETLIPLYSTSGLAISHLVGLMMRKRRWSVSRTWRTWQRCDSKSGLAMSMSSTYTKQWGISPRIWSFILRKVQSAFLKPNGVLIHSKRPKKVITAVFGMSPLAIKT